MTFTPEQTASLAAKLNASDVKSREQGGRKVSYIEGWHAIAEANRIFGFDGWSRQTVETTCIWSGERPTKNGPKPAASYTARVRVTVWAGDRELIREGTGAGSGFGQDAGEAHESAVKEAETDAMKRALITFGNPFGLALYDKSQENVERAPPAEQPSAQRAPATAAKAVASEDAHKPVFDIGKAALLMTKTVKEYNGWIDDNAAMLEQLEKAAPKMYADLCAIGEAHLKGLAMKSEIRMAG